MDVNEPVRGLGNFPPSLWGDRYSNYSFNQSAYKLYDVDIEVLKGEVRGTLIDPAIKSKERMFLINDLYRLGLSYHFEKEIDCELETLFTNLNFKGIEDYDLHTISFQLQVFRAYGYKMPCDTFNKFKDQTGNFKETLVTDVRGLLSFYEACQSRLRGEDVLEKGLVFATAHLSSLSTDPSPQLLKQITQVLRRPFHKGMPRVEAGLYISIYANQESRNESILKLAMMDFNKLQLLHLQELGVVSKWWKDLEMATKLPYVRDRVVESYFWILGVNFEPRSSLQRIRYAKLTALLLILDDTFDAYGTVDELKLFTDAVDRWDASAMSTLPEYMKYIYSILLDLYGELDEQMTREGREYASYYAKEANTTVRLSGQTVVLYQFDEYLENATLTCGHYIMSVNCFTGMGDVATNEAFVWLRGRPKVLRASETIARLQDDIVTHETEQKRGQFASAVEYYMKQYGVPKRETIIELEGRIEDAWKDMNEECLKPTIVSKDLLMVCFNLARVIDVMYKYDDGFTNAEMLREFITLLFDNTIAV